MAQMVKNLPKCRRVGFDLWVRKIPWWKEWLPTPVFLPGKFHGQRDVFHFHVHSLYKPRNAKDCQQITKFSSDTWLCATLCDPMDYSTPGFPIHHQLLELAQTHVHRVSDAIQPSHPLLSPSPAFNLSQHQGLFQWVGSSDSKVVKTHGTDSPSPPSEVAIPSVTLNSDY